jgi:hypothetical protein
MRKLLVAALAALSSLVACAALANTRSDCQPQAIRDLSRLAPQAHAVYVAMRDKRQFLAFLSCEDVQLGLATAVHESVHILTEQLDAYPLIHGGSLPRRPVLSRFYPPREIAGNFQRDDSYVQTYLRRGAATAAENLAYLLDELNAYSHDLAAASRLVSLHKGNGQVDHRAGLAALMAFLTQYVEVARERKPATWDGLRQAEVQKLIAALWQQAEATLVDSLGIEGFGGEVYVRRLCEPRTGEALAELLGRSPLLSSACGSVKNANSPSASVSR